ncbi:MAG: hypothetical protein Q9162_007789 [Coniocarpon cinnabarinum]
MEQQPLPEGQQQQQRQQTSPKQKRPPMYELGKEGHYGACQQIASQDRAPDPHVFQGAWANVTQGLTGVYRGVLSTYWSGMLRHLEDAEHDFKQQQLPLARIKKVMKADPEVKMISAEAPILFAKGCDIFITELTMRAWIHAEENKRRTLQRSDIAFALTKSDMFDFLIDIVPREEAGASHAKRPSTTAGPPGAPPPQQTPMTQQPGMPPQPTAHQPPPPHHGAPPEYPGFPQHVPEQDFRGQPTMYMQPGQPDPSQYQQPQAPLFDQSMYGSYPMAPQQMYQMPPQRTEPPPAAGHYRPHDAGEVEEDAQGEREYEV